MWWEPRNSDDAALAAELRRMEGLFLEHRPRGTVFGVGSWMGQGWWWLRRLPISRRRWLNCSPLPWRLPLPCPRYSYGYYPPCYWFTTKPLPLVLLNVATAEWPVMPMLPYSYVDLPPTSRAEVAQWDLPTSTVFLFVSPPEGVNATVPVTTSLKRAIRCARSRSVATAGIRLNSLAPRQAGGAFLTVGHVFPHGHHSEVESVEYRWPRWLRSPRYEPLGRVVCHSTPAGAQGPSYDAAVVVSDHASALPNLAHSGVAQTPSHYEQPAVGRIYGGVSGVLPMGIVGTLNAYGSATMCWKNSWILLPLSPARQGIVQGDSGGAFVLNASNEVAGMVVGASWVGTSNECMVQYVQDMASIRNDFLRPAGFTVA